MTNATRIKLITAGVTVAGTVLAVGDKIVAIPGVPGWAANAWPMVYGAALLFDRVAHILWPDATAIAPTAKPSS